MSEAAEIEALEESSRNTKVKLLDIGANLRQQIEALEHASRTPEPLAEEPALKRQRQGLFPCGCGAGSTKTLKPVGSFDEDECGGCTNGHGGGICGGNGCGGNYGGCGCGSCSGPCGCGNCGGNSNWAGSCGGSCSSCCGGSCNGGCCQGGCCTGGCTGCGGPVCGCGGCGACGNCCGCGGCGNCGCGNGSCGGNCNGCGCPGNCGCGGCGCGCGCCGCGSCGGPSLPGCNGCDGMNSMNPMAMMMAAMMGQMMASSGGGSTEHSPTKLSKEDEDDTSTYGSSFNVSHPNYRPPDMEHKPGITDKRFIGRIKFWFETKGFGFIESEEFSKVFGGDSDVFLHHFQKRHYQQGDLVEFSVFTNFRGKPQGTELRKVKQ